MRQMTHLQKMPLTSVGYETEEWKAASSSSPSSVPCLWANGRPGTGLFLMQINNKKMLLYGMEAGERYRFPSLPQDYLLQAHTI